MQQDWIERGKEVLAIEIEGLENARQHLGEAFARAVEMLGACRGRVILTGIGKSGLVGRKIAATMSSTGTPAFFLHPVEGAHGDLGSVREGDVVIAISYSGRTDELNAILPALRGLGANIIALTAGMNSPLADLADVAINAAIPREACPMNLAPTSSTTATLALGDALAVCLIEYKSFTASDFKRYHPGGMLGQRLGLKVADLMHTQNIPMARDGVSFGEALNALDAGGIGAVVIVDGAGRLIGILTDGDVRRLLCKGLADSALPVVKVMTQNPCHARPNMSTAELIDIMENKGITVLPVLDNRAMMLGIVHLHDLLGKGRIKFTSAEPL